MTAIKTLFEIVLNIIIFIIIFQSSTLIHELGHAIPALILTKKNVKIRLGTNSQKLKKINLKGLCIELRSFNPFIGFVNWDKSNITDFEVIIILTSGPIVSLVFGIMLVFIGRNMGNKLLLETIFLKEMLVFAGNYLLFTFISTSIPIIYPTWWKGYANLPSDGYQVLTLIKGR